MPAIVWTIARANGDTRTFTEWGISRAIDHRINLATGSVELGFGRADLLGNLPFDANETILIAADGDPYFRGRIISEKRAAAGSSEAGSVTLADPWWYLENLVFMRNIAVVGDPNANPAPADAAAGLQLSDFGIIMKLSSDIILSESEQGSLIGGRPMVLAALNYAISRGAPIAIGTIDAGLAIPREELRDVTCAEVIRKSLRWTPDQTAWWDYSVNPPALNIRARSNRPLLTLDVNDKAIQEVALDPRYDLILPGVTIEYLRRHQRTNFEFVTLDYDVAGPDANGIGALVVTIELYGTFLAQGPTTADGTPPAEIIAQEAAPVGIAAAVYNAWKDLSFDGRASFFASDPFTLYLSKTFRVANGAPLWAAATIDIQEVAIDLFALDDADGENYAVTLTVGHSIHLSPSDLAARIRKGRTTPPPQVPNNSPKLPTLNYNNPDLPKSNAHGDVVLYFYFGQDVGFPNSWGGFDGDIADVHDLEGDIPSQVRAVDIGGAALEAHGLRFVRVNRYIPRSQSITPLLRNAGYLGLGSKPNVIVNAYKTPPEIIG